MGSQRIQSVLIVDDEDMILSASSRGLRARGLVPHVAKTLNGAVRTLQSIACDLIILDLRLGDESGLDLLKEAVARKVKVVIVSGYASVALTVKAMRSGATAVLTKPASLDEILDAVNEASPTDPILPSLERAEWEHLQRALLQAEGNISEAARRLKLPRRTLQRKLRKLPPLS